MLEGIVLDFDGVIADSEPLHFRTFREVLSAERIDLTEADYYARYLGFSDADAFRMIGRTAGRSWSDELVATLIARKAARLEELERDTSVLFPGAERFIHDASALVPLAIASGALRAEIVRVLNGAGLTRYFSAIVAADDVAASKPAPEPYMRAVSLLSAASRYPIAPASCVAIEDSHWGIESAHAAGLRTVAVTHSYDAAALGAADLIVSSLGALSVTELRRLVSD